MKGLKEQVVKAIKLEIALLEQKILDNYTEAIRIIYRGFVINANIKTSTNTVITALMDSYHEGLLKHTHMDKSQFREA